MDKHDKQVEEIEAAQKALRQCIDATKDLAEKAEKLVKKHKRTLKSDQPDD
ncbi:MAG: hypothetical protein H0W65_03335 [Sphingomonas sp.]|uniref:hypothetical protein n=1 Tax=Sphingomonas sp. TaxID=28214 RepID=UPI0017D70A88|nr:hypothetical protein [Sphingomonas sp.]MBA3666741.1 hypothetical protein [Sphingomonas sp.]